MKTLQQQADELGISRQAVWQKTEKGKMYLKSDKHRAYSKKYMREYCKTEKNRKYMREYMRNYKKSMIDNEYRKGFIDGAKEQLKIDKTL